MIDTLLTEGKLNTETDNKGFTLVEVLVCIAILAIAAIPLFQSMAMTARANGKAQGMQNANSICESIMEEVKAKSLDDIASQLNGDDTDGKPNVVSIAKSETEFDSGSAGDRADWASALSDTDGTFLTGGSKEDPYYVVYYPNRVSNAGDEYNATVFLRATDYKQGTADLSTTDDTTDDNVEGANIVKLPRIDQIDTLSQAALSKKDFEKYDQAAADYFDQKKASYSSSGGASIATKKINIMKDDVDDDSDGVSEAIKVECKIVYIDTEGNSFARSLYTGTFARQFKEGSTSDYKELDSNIYLFYRRTVAEEIINVTDKTTGCSHNVYLVMQDDDSGNRITNITGTTLNVTNGTKTITVDASKYSLLHPVNPTVDASGLQYKDGNITQYVIEADGSVSDKAELKVVTNLGTNASNEGYIYEKDAKIRILDITVELTKDGESEPYATLSSTKKVKLTTPIPTP